MDWKRFSLRLLLVAFALTSLAMPFAVRYAQNQGMSISSGGKKKAPKELETVARSKTANRSRVAQEDMEVTSSATATFPKSGRVAYHFDIRNKRDGSYYQILLDKDGNELDQEQLLAEEQTAQLAKNGKLDDALAEYIEKASADELIPVQVWLVESDDESGLPKQQLMTSEQWNRMTEEEKKAYEDQEEMVVKRRREINNSRVKTLVDPIVKRLKKMGYECNTLKTSPIIFVDAEPRVIKEMEGWPEVERISIRLKVIESLDQSRKAVGADIVEARGVPNLRTILAAVVEVNGNIATNPFLPDITQNFTNVCDTPSSHGLAVAGVIASTHSLVRGVDPTAGIWAGGGCTGASSEIQTAVDNAILFGANLINLSLGVAGNASVLSDYDRFMDSKVRNDRVTIVVSSGNIGPFGTCVNPNPYVSSPGKAYNVITVGAYNDKQSPQHADDEISIVHCHRNPDTAFDDSEKPEVLAPGVNIRSLIPAPPWTEQFALGGLTGTSVAAPHVTGQVALMRSRTKILSKKPEAVKAIVIASAGHFILENGVYPLFKEGAGTISTNWADDILTGTIGGWGEFAYNCSSPDPAQVAAIFLQIGIRVRIAIAWSQKPGYNQYTLKPSADLNLELRDPQGVLVNPVGNSHDSTWEFIQFIPNMTGAYTINITRRNCSDIPNDVVAYAWAQMP